MAKGISLHVGINQVSATDFSAAPLRGPENDARAMRAIAVSKGFSPTHLLLGAQANFKAVVAEIENAASVLKAGDIFLFTFAGHGCRVTDLDVDVAEEPDRKDEALVLFDRLLLDDFLRRVLWPKFEAGVRILGVLDSCHSETALLASIHVNVGQPSLGSPDDADILDMVASADESESLSRSSKNRHWNDSSTADWAVEGFSPPAPDEEAMSADFTLRTISSHARQAHLTANKIFYDDLKIPSIADAPPVRASRLLLAACGDKEDTPDGDPDGLFTKLLLDVWDGGIGDRQRRFSGSYLKFLDDIKAKFNGPNRTPRLTSIGLPDFRDKDPFSI
jgi:hypothetical protein